MSEGRERIGSLGYIPALQPPNLGERQRTCTEVGGSSVDYLIISIPLLTGDCIQCIR